MFLLFFSSLIASSAALLNSSSNLRRFLENSDSAILYKKRCKDLILPASYSTYMPFVEEIPICVLPVEKSCPYMSKLLPPSPDENVEVSEW